MGSDAKKLLKTEAKRAKKEAKARIKAVKGVGASAAGAAAAALAWVVDPAAVVVSGLVAVPAGSTLFGTVEQVRSQKRIGGQARLLLFFDTLELPSGESLPVEATLQLAGKRQSKKDAATIGSSAAGGAILGRVLSRGDRDKGTVLGAVLGAAVGTAVASNNRGDPVLVDAGLRAEVMLEAPIEVAVRQQVDVEERIASTD